MGAVTNPRAARLGGLRAEVPPCGFGDRPLLSKGTHSQEPGLPVLRHHRDRGDPNVPGVSPRSPPPRATPPARCPLCLLRSKHPLPKKQLIPWEKQSRDHQSNMAGWKPEEYPSSWEVSRTPCRLVHPKRELASAEGFAPSTSNPDSIPLPLSHAIFPQLLQCHSESIQIMLEAL